MKLIQKERIEYLRRKGASYAAIAADLGIPESTVKSHCRRNNLGAEFSAKQSAPPDDVCGYCNAPLKHTPKAKKKRFCNDTCRMAWWNAHPAAVNRKAFYSFICPTCGNAFDSYGNAGRVYCSRECLFESRRKPREQG